MSCVGNTCGVGGWGGPLPGDPGNNSILTATPAFGGIDVAWTYPSTNPWAVAYTKVYRGLTSNFNSALLIKETSHTFWYDRIETPTRYYYWIILVSVNEGTEGELIGPATAVAKPTIEGMIELLTGQIDSGVLATALRDKIDRITLVESELFDEITARENSETSFSEAVAAVQAGVAQTLTFIGNESQSRIDGLSAMAESIELVAVTSADNLAEAVVQLRTEIEAGAGGDISVLAERIEQVAVEAADNLAIAESSLTTSINLVGDDVEALSLAITGVETEVGENLAQAQTLLQTNIDTVDGKVTSIGALYTAKVTVNGLVGGFGIYNDGTEVQAGFDVDTFWIGRTSADKRKPFIISDGVVYIDEAAINSLSFSKLKNESGSFIVSSGRLNKDYLDSTLETSTGAQSKADAAAVLAVNAAAIAAQTKADLAETIAKAYADGLVTDEEVRAIADAQAKADAAQAAAIAAAALDATAKADVAATTANWSSVAGKPTFGAFAALNQITSADVNTYIAAAAIDYTRIGVLQAGNLSVTALRDTINGGVTSLGRIDITTKRIDVIDDYGQLRGRFGML